MLKFTIVVMLLLWAAPLAGQDAGAAERIAAAKRRVSAAGIPVALLDSKIAEGQAKGVPMDRIAAAVEIRAAALARAQTAMAQGGRAVNSADLSVGAEALQAGVSEDVLQELAETAPDGQRAVAIAVLAQLVRQGHASGQALEQVKAAIAQGPDALRTLPARAKPGRGRGGPPQGKGPGADQSKAGKGKGAGGPPASVPAPGKKPGSGKPDKAGKGNKGGGNKPGKPGKPGGKP